MEQLPLGHTAISWRLCHFLRKIIAQLLIALSFTFVIKQALIPKVYAQYYKGDQNYAHLGLVVQRSYPYFLKEIDAAHYLYRSPEHNHSGYSHTDIGAPRSQSQLLGKDEECADKATQTYKQSHRMVIAEEAVVVTEHQQQIAAPQYHHQFHKSDDAHVACHRPGHYLIFLAAEQTTLPPVDKVAVLLE